MKRLLLAMTIIFAVACSAPKGNVAAEVAIIPQPLSLVQHNNNFAITPSTTLVCEAMELAPLVAYTKEYLAIRTDKSLPKSNYISITLDNSLVEEEYKLSVSTESVKIVAGGYGGAFNGMQTLFQLLPSEVYTKQMQLPATVQGCEVQDRPKFAYRGFMLDVARTFIERDNVLRYIDYIAYHKINKLHWHLADNQGWRIEIKSHPDLAKIGGFRGGDSPLRSALGKWNEKYGGYYTQEEIKEIVAYAAQRNIEVIPEIDLPGHSEALLRVYPEMLCNYTNDELSVNGDYDARNVVCATKESNYRILEEILSEVCALFPSKRIHIGGDEVNMSQWQRCPDCSAWLKRNGYTDGHKLESMFISRIQKILAKYGKSSSVWNEAAKGGSLSKEALVYSWQRVEDCKEVLSRGYNTILMPQLFFYYDMRQSIHENAPIWREAVDVRKTYSFDFAELGFAPETIALVKGFEGAYWSEYLLSQGGDKSLDFLDYQCFPRLCALAEQGWGKNGGEWEEFHTRLYSRHYDRMADMGLRFRITPPVVKYEDGLLSLERIDNSTLYYRDDATGKVRRYKKAIRTDKPAKYLFWAEYRGAKSPEVAHSSHYETIQPKVKLTSSMPENPKYGYGRVSEYYMKMRTTRTCHKGDWLLYEFEEPVECRAIEFCVRNYHMPITRLIHSGHIEISEDGKNFERVADLEFGAVRLINPHPFKAARIECNETAIGGSDIRISAPLIYPKY